MQRKLTVDMDVAVYDALHRQIGREYISTFIEDLVRSRVYIDPDLEMAYREMAADDEAELEALEWVEGLIGDSTP
jgi:hypothetical protein